MAKSKSTGSNKPHYKGQFAAGPRPFWTGVVSFGLVTLPVSLYPANRGTKTGLVMVDDKGERLNRRYKCSREQKLLSAEQIVRGYEVDTNRFVTVEDDELKALAPEKSNEINLQRFVCLNDINPIFFDKGYFLAPDADAVKAYRLLAQSMERENRAGIATFVMRDREYLVAIVAEAGILRAETLRFDDEIRSPEEVGLPDIPAAKPAQVKKIQKQISKLAGTQLDRAEFKDAAAEQLLQKVQKKLKSKKDVVVKKPPSRPRARVTNNDEPAQIIDLMEVIKARVRGDSPPAANARQAKTSDSKAKSKKKGAHVKPSTSSSAQNREGVDDLRQRSRDELYQKAKELNLSGRSSMSKSELIDAINAAES